MHCLHHIEDVFSLVEVSFGSTSAWVHAYRDGGGAHRSMSAARIKQRRVMSLTSVSPRLGIRVIVKTSVSPKYVQLHTCLGRIDNCWICATRSTACTCMVHLVITTLCQNFIFFIVIYSPPGASHPHHAAVCVLRVVLALWWRRHACAHIWFSSANMTTSRVQFTTNRPVARAYNACRSYLSAFLLWPHQHVRGVENGENPLSPAVMNTHDRVMLLSVVGLTPKAI